MSLLFLLGFFFLHDMHVFPSSSCARTEKENGNSGWMTKSGRDRHTIFYYQFLPLKCVPTAVKVPCMHVAILFTYNQLSRYSCYFFRNRLTGTFRMALSFSVKTWKNIFAIHSIHSSLVEITSNALQNPACTHVCNVTDE